MLSEDPDPGWLKLPSGGYVSPDVIKSYDRKIFPPITQYRKFIDDDDEVSLLDVSYMDAGAFNEKARRYDVYMEKSDTPIERLVKYSVYMSRERNEKSFIPDNNEVHSLIFDASTAKAKGNETLASFFFKFPDSYSFVTREILEFRGKRKGGEYSADRYIFNKNDGVLEKKDAIIVPGQGHIRALDPGSGYPLETSEERGPIENLHDIASDCSDIRGHWFVGLPPKKGESRLVIRNTHHFNSCLLDINVGDKIFHADNTTYALRIRDKYPMWQKIRDFFFNP